MVVGLALLASLMSGCQTSEQRAGRQADSQMEQRMRSLEQSMQRMEHKLDEINQRLDQRNK